MADIHPSELKQIVLSLCMGLGLSASCGFRVFVPPLLLALGLKFHFVQPDWVAPELADFIQSSGVLLALLVATFLEILASKIPGVDHLLDLIEAPLALLAGTLLTATFLVNIEDPWIRYGFSLIAGGGSAGAIHAGSAAVRGLSTKTTLTLANPFYSSLETLLSFVGSAIALFLPLLMVFFLMGIGLFILKIRKKFRPTG